MHTRLFIAAATSHPRHAVVSALSTALGDVGWIVDFQKFSNLALGVQFELPRHNLPKLCSVLVALPLSLSAESLDAFEALESTAPSELPDPISGSLHVTFVHSEPDLRIPVPAIPG